jgi:hypothetical protein
LRRRWRTLEAWNTIETAWRADLDASPQLLQEDLRRRWLAISLAVLRLDASQSEVLDFGDGIGVGWRLCATRRPCFLEDQRLHE